MDAWAIGGFVAAEGCFTMVNSANRFAFAIGLAATDRSVCDELAAFFSVGHVYGYPRRQPHNDDEVTYAMQSIRELVDVIVPFMDEHLPQSYKRAQYEQWRAALVDYWEHKAKRRPCCMAPGCRRPNRAKGLCRGHYYQRYRR